MKTKQLGFFACIGTLLLSVGLSSGTVYAQGNPQGPKTNKVVILDCDFMGVQSVDSNFDLDFPLSKPDPHTGMAPTLNDLPDICSEAIAFLLDNKFKIEGSLGGFDAFAGGFHKSYTMVSKK